MSCCGDVMKPIEAAACCTPKESAVQAARAMSTSGCGCAPVVENREEMKLVGVVTERDLCCGVVADDRTASNVRVDEIMRPAAACCGTEDTLDQGRSRMHEHRTTSLPVVNKAGGCCGTISLHAIGR